MSPLTLVRESNLWDPEEILLTPSKEGKGHAARGLPGCRRGSGGERTALRFSMDAVAAARDGSRCLDAGRQMRI